LVLLLIASAGILALAALFLSGGPDRVELVRAGAVAQESLGVRAAAADSARRGDSAVAEEPATSPVLPEIRPEAVGIDRRVEGRPEVQQATPPVEPSEADVARSEAIAAAMPAAMKDFEGGLDAKRRGLRNACWKGGQGSAKLPVEASFAADGSLLALSISDDRASPAGLGTCLRAQPLPLSISAPGVEVTVKTMLTLP